ncbi:MAG: sensor histidine kinase, partial [Deltaproteobacteria bacterium]|nr:sensor histidine kinase [Deltaproteobacteria bacterium]
LVDIRDLAYNLRPAALDDLGLAQAISQLCEEFSARNGLTVDLITAGIEGLKLDFDTEITIYRLIQEGLNNALNHADAGLITVRLVTSFPFIILRLEDDGRGFDVPQRLAVALSERRMGLSSMRERVSLLRGKMRLESLPGKGTKIVIEVPYKENRP